MKIIKLFIDSLIIVIFFCFTTVASGGDFARPALVVNPKATIKGEKIKLGEISKISYNKPEFETIATKLASIELGEAPAPMSSTTLVGSSILNAIEEAGISSDSIGYSVPKTIMVERAGREVTKEEIINALKDKFSQKDILDIQVKDVSWNSSQVVPLGETSYDIYRLGDLSGGKIPLRIEVLVDKFPAARFLATAIADDWREIPILKRTLDRGMLIRAEDVQLVRLNLYKQPEDTIYKADSVIGKRAKGRLVAGDVIRASAVDIPPTIPRGNQVTVFYERSGLVATILGQTLEDGFDGGAVMVRNIKSQKVLKARVRNSEQVEVIQE